MTAGWFPSPNHNERPTGRGVEGVVIHATAGRSESVDVAWCRTPKDKLPKGYSPVSYHWIVGRDGDLYQLVAESRRAWHAGRSHWLGKDGCNDFTVGVALSYHPDEGNYPTAQLDAAATLVADILARRGLDITRMAGHCHVSPGRKQDPYDTFPWGHFNRAVADLLHPPPEPIALHTYVPPHRYRPAA